MDFFLFSFSFVSNLSDFEEGNPLLDLSSLDFEGGNLSLTTIVTRLVDFSFKFGWIHECSTKYMNSLTSVFH